LIPVKYVGLKGSMQINLSKAKELNTNITLVKQNQDFYNILLDRHI